MPGTGGPPAKTGNLAIPPLGLCPANIHRLRRRDQPITPHRNGHRAQFSDGLLGGQVARGRGHVAGGTMTTERQIVMTSASADW